MKTGEDRVERLIIFLTELRAVGERSLWDEAGGLISLVMPQKSRLSEDTRTRQVSELNYRLQVRADLRPQSPCRRPAVCGGR